MVWTKILYFNKYVYIFHYLVRCIPQNQKYNEANKIIILAEWKTHLKSNI